MDGAVNSAARCRTWKSIAGSFVVRVETIPS
jgi:hypothetical protein